jgi:hypothetical protein
MCEEPKWGGKCTHFAHNEAGCHSNTTGFLNYHSMGPDHETTCNIFVDTLCQKMIRKGITWPGVDEGLDKFGGFACYADENAPIFSGGRWVLNNN